MQRTFFQSFLLGFGLLVFGSWYRMVGIDFCFRQTLVGFDLGFGAPAADRFRYNIVPYVLRC